MSDLVDDYLRIMRSLNPDPVLLSRIEALEAARRDEPVVDAPLDVAMAVAERQMEKWRTTLDWLADR